jgi:[ribosomal protein S5]-alanine N-acetyltransferase
MSTSPDILRTPRLELVAMTLEMVEAVMSGRRADAEALVVARMPQRWPNPELVERAFTASLDSIRAEPHRSLWGNRVIIAHGEGGEGSASGVSPPTPPSGERRVVGSVVFHGAPSLEGIAEIAYGVEEGSQGRGYASEAVDACVAWALAQDRVLCVQAATFPWHQPSLRVLAKVGMVPIGSREHETLGDMLVFERRRG